MVRSRHVQVCQLTSTYNSDNLGQLMFNFPAKNCSYLRSVPEFGGIFQELILSFTRSTSNSFSCITFNLILAWADPGLNWSWLELVLAWTGPGLNWSALTESFLSEKNLFKFEKQAWAEKYPTRWKTFLVDCCKSETNKYKEKATTIPPIAK